ncbi:MAG: methylated-DNA--[protein]-cysteine S-methyltransferase [Promethearchaeota archaeon]
MDSIEFFSSEIDIIDYLEKEQLELIEEKELIEKGSIHDLKKLITNYLSGMDVNLSNKIKDLDIELNIEEKFQTKFSQNVINNILTLNRGETTSYSEIGRKIGSKAYRAIGNVLKNNPVPLIIPCHRVIRKNGDIGGFMGETNNSWQQNIKKDLLRIEQITDI